MNKLDIRRIPIQIVLLLLFTLGFLGGVVLTFLNSQSLITEMEIFTPKFFYKLENITIDKRALFTLALGRQLYIFFMLIFLSTSAIRMPIFCSYAALQGIFVGSTVELLLIVYGIVGMGLYGLLVLPHGIFYFLGYSILLVQGMKYSKEKVESYALFEEKKERRKKLFISLLLLVIGSITEAYCNLFLLFY